ncbi:hypothetical protein DIPPA_07414 [Diplonema papillatum]|nr:hypothetical protein DIPPA_07414 [Diplonema papillatum]
MLHPAPHDALRIVRQGAPAVMAATEATRATSPVAAGETATSIFHGTGGGCDRRPGPTLDVRGSATSRTAKALGFYL